jgi:2-keto-4-pentenoate hydratase/2-oxohepta-3-ene-1,7-dioic acid hydratase in catechol pathway
MKLVRYGLPGAERPGLLDGDGVLRDITAFCADIDGAALAGGLIETLRNVPLGQLPVVEPVGQGVHAWRYGPCIARPGKFIGIGLNYADHAKEAGQPIPAEPVLFMKASTSISGPNDDIIQPPHSTKLDWEAELGVVIGKKAQYIDEADALAHVAGYCVVNDVSERNFQMERGPTWDRGKGCDTFGPTGPWLVTADEVPDPQALELWLDLNGVRMQTGSTATMIFSVAQVVSYLSHFMTLEPGDLITTGTPPGVGMGMKPPRWLAPGDVVELGVQGLGRQRQTVVAHPLASAAT